MQNADKLCLKHPPAGKYRPPACQCCSNPIFHQVGESTRTSAAPCPHPKFALEERSIYERLSHSFVLECCCKFNGSLLLALVWLLLSTLIFPRAIILIIPRSFQNVQHTSALGASLRILPSLVVGFCIQLTTGLLIHRTTPYLLVLSSLLLSAGSPLLMALISAHWPYWYAAFPAQLLAPLSCDILFTIGLLAISEEFPADTQALAGAVFNTAAQFGSSLGLTLLAVVSASVTKSEDDHGTSTEEGLLAGYRAGFWSAFASMGLACLIGGFGLRRMGRVGVKTD